MQADLVLAAWWRTRRAMRMKGDALTRVRARYWRKLQPTLARTPALAAYAGCALEDYPITDPDTLRADYGAWNSAGLTGAELRQLADMAEAGNPGDGLSAGWSTGTGGGTRGLFVATPAERAEYLGQSLARLLPARALLRRQRLALHLRANNALYSDVKRCRFAFAHFPLDAPTARTMADLTAFDPTVLVAPPHRLLAFAAAGLQLRNLHYLFYGSEPLSGAEANYLAAAFGLRPRAILQATEGFLGADCHEGRLHLNEHAIHVELEPVAGTVGFRPILTDLFRTSQPIVRLRGDDYLELEPSPCACGFVARTIRPVQGRVGDIWRMNDRTVTPPQVVEAVENSLGADWRWQASAKPGAVMLRVEDDTPSDLTSEAIEELGQLTGQSVALSRGLAPWPGAKRSKVVWANG